MFDQIDEALNYTAFLVTGSPDHLTVDDYQSRATSDPQAMARSIEAHIEPSRWEMFIQGIDHPRAKAVVAAYLQHSERSTHD